MTEDLPILSGAFAAFARQGGYVARPEGGALMIASEAGGEIRFSVHRRGDDLVLTRAERSEDERLIMWSSAVGEIENYLTVVIGDDVRAVTGLGMLDGPTDAPQLATGQHVVQVGDSAFAISRADGIPDHARFATADTAAPVYTYSATVGHSADAVRAAYLAPDGAPLFRLWQPRPR
ncbi:hypothetical protein ET475_08910 [Microbacterium protaetiae]|uniref:Uncharacterized protein n=1 Tax=Microbacterium protaetiae TaxID=2509458 RepID=A0A4P6EIU7_9MICO|nr:Imm61 family immunity protein [Microbacterium protaetiae]QAY60097.1 hypothetical protein ET475_08910 [Microbacterium protaetiae]